MILIGLGANLAHPDLGTPRATCEAALTALAAAGVGLCRRSRWYQSAPMPPSDQPWYVNGVVAVEVGLAPVGLLALLHRVEAALGRVRGAVNAARVIDLDLLDYDGLVRPGPEPPILPHPRLGERAFVLKPLAEIAPDWRHPVTGASVAALIRALPAGAVAEPLAEGASGERGEAAR